MSPDARVALYWAPDPDDPLWQAACTWLGRDPARDVALPQPAIDGIAEITADARLYGFHATLKPPMRLADGQTLEALVAATRTLAADIAPFDLPPLAVYSIDGFLALCETEPCPPLHALVDRVVEGLDAFRRPPSEAELARRRKAKLTPRQDALLVRWGYPYVFNEWRFHLTLTRRLDAAEMARIRPAAEAYLAPALPRARRVHDVSVYVQPEAGAPFRLEARVKLGGSREHQPGPAVNATA